MGSGIIVFGDIILADDGDKGVENRILHEESPVSLYKSSVLFFHASDLLESPSPSLSVSVSVRNVPRVCDDASGRMH